MRREHALHRAERRGRDGDGYDNLPGDTRRVLEGEARRPGRVVADLFALEEGRGPDARWNEVEARLRGEGTMAQGIRRRWAGGILDWAATPRDAFDLAVHLTHKYALDGRDPLALAELTSIFRLDKPVKPEKAPKGRNEGGRPPRRKGRTRSISKGGAGPRGVPPSPSTPS